MKQLFPYALDMTGIEQFEAMRLLEEKGVLCASPLAATKRRLITQWINGKKAYCAGERLTPYLEALDEVLKKLVAQGKWNPKWRIERQPDNYIINDLHSRNPLRRFIAVDPVYIHSAIEFG